MSEAVVYVPGKLYVRASRSAQEQGEKFGPVKDQDSAESLLRVLASRADIVKAEIIVESE